jgi:hypothetical protein
VDSLSIEQANFGTPMLAAYHTVWAERVRTYSGNTMLTALLSEGFTAYSPIYRMAAALLGQSPKVEEVKVGRLALPFTQDQELEVTSNTEDDVVTVTITDPAGADHVCSYTVVALDTLNDVAIGLKAAIDAEAMDVTIAAPAGAELQVVADNPGEVFYYSANDHVDLLDDTPDPGIATDLAAIELADSDWYGLLLDLNSFAIVDAAAGWIETQRKLYGAQTQDSEVPTSGTGDIATELEGDARVRTPIIYHHGPDASLADYPACAWFGKTLPKDPGSQTWSFKTLSGVTYNSLTPNQLSELKGKHCNMYVRIAGVNITRHGWAPDGTWIDQTRMVDWLQARIEEALFALMAGSDKLPYDDDGVELIRGAIFGVYSEGADNGGLELEDFQFSAPLAADQAAADRTARIMRDIQFGGRLTGAIHEIYVTGAIVQ